MVLVPSSPKSVGLEIRVKMKAALMGLKSAGQASRLGTQAGFLCCRIRAEAFFSREAQVLLLWLSTC